uniref:Ig-like domain-containing protein n=1 Tax=Oryzias latipes TaxID=8090 RepID=A0A3P9JGS9_ORYLA
MATTLSVQIESPKIQRPKSTEIVVYLGKGATLHCPASGKPAAQISWILPDRTFVQEVGTVHSVFSAISLLQNGTLQIHSTNFTSKGDYKCIASNAAGADTITYHLHVAALPPSISEAPTDSLIVQPGTKKNYCFIVFNRTVQSMALFVSIGLRNRRYHINKKDEGDYTCYAKNKLGKDERKLSVRVAPKSPQIGLKSQSKVTVKLGESTKLECKATGEPLPKIIWISPQKDVIPLSTEKFEIMDDGMLIIKKVSLGDEGKYACVARNSVGGDIKYTTVEVEHQKPFINGMKGESSTKLLGVSYQTALMDCRVEGKPVPKIWWITPYGLSLTTPYLGGRFQVHQNGSLELRGVRKTDEGRYTCLAKNHLGETSLSVELQVASLAEKPSFAVPNIEILPIKQDGSGISLKCPARGKPNPELSWLLPNGTMLTPGLRLQRFIHHLLNGTLQIFNPVANDKGVYRCIARNMAGQAEKRYALEAGRKPVIRGYTVDGWPQASITWTLPNGAVLDKPQTIGRISFFNNGTLQIKQVATFDKGTYICKATNAYGSTALSYPVTVMVFPPRITTTMPPITKINQGTPVILQCVANGMPKPDISWTLPGRTTLLPQNRYTVRGGIHISQEGYLVIQNPVLTNSGIYKCNAKNALGTDFKSTYLQVV